MADEIALLTKTIQMSMCHVMCEPFGPDNLSGPLNMGGGNRYWTKHTLAFALQQRDQLPEGEAAVSIIQSCLEGAPDLFTSVPDDEPGADIPSSSGLWRMACPLNEALKKLSYFGRDPAMTAVEERVEGPTAWDRLLEVDYG